MSRDTLVALVDARPTQCTHRVVYGLTSRRIYIPLAEVERLRGKRERRRKLGNHDQNGNCGAPEASKTGTAEVVSR